MAKSKEVAKKEDSELSVYDYSDEQESGFEGIGIDELPIPYFAIVQPTSRDLEEQIVEGIAAGDIINHITKEIMPQPFPFLPVYHDHWWVEWVPRKDGGGQVARHDPESDIVKDIIKKNNNSKIPPAMPDGSRPSFKVGKNELIETYYVYGLLLNEEGTESVSFGCMSFTSTKIKVRNNWLGSMMALKGRPPLFIIRSKVSSVKEKRPGGTSYNYHISPFNDNWLSSLVTNDEKGKALVEDAKSFRKVIQSKEYEIVGESPSNDEPEERKSGFDDDIPF